MGYIIFSYEWYFFLPSSGANIEAKDVDNYTPLLTAAEFGQTEIFRLLLELKPRPASLTVHNMTGKSALFLAAESNHPEIIKVLIQINMFLFKLNDGYRFKMHQV